MALRGGCAPTMESVRNDPYGLVGRKIAVEPQSGGAPQCGVVTAFDAHDGQHYVALDGQGMRWCDLPTKRFWLLSDGAPGESPLENAVEVASDGGKRSSLKVPGAPSGMWAQGGASPTRFESWTPYYTSVAAARTDVEFVCCVDAAAVGEDDVLEVVGTDPSLGGGFGADAVGVRLAETSHAGIYRGVAALRLSYEDRSADGILRFGFRLRVKDAVLVELAPKRVLTRLAPRVFASAGFRDRPAPPRDAFRRLARRPQGPLFNVKRSPPCQSTLIHASLRETVEER